MSVCDTETLIKLGDIWDHLVPVQKRILFGIIDTSDDIKRLSNVSEDGIAETGGNLEYLVGQFYKASPECCDDFATVVDVYYNRVKPCLIHREQPEIQ